MLWSTLKMNSTKVLISTNNNKTFMMQSTDISTLLIFSDQIKVLDSTGQYKVQYSTVQIKKMKP